MTRLKQFYASLAKNKREVASTAALTLVVVVNMIAAVLLFTDGNWAQAIDKLAITLFALVLMAANYVIRMMQETIDIQRGTNEALLDLAKDQEQELDRYNGRSWN